MIDELTQYNEEIEGALKKLREELEDSHLDSGLLESLGLAYRMEEGEIYVSAIDGLRKCLNELEARIDSFLPSLRVVEGDSGIKFYGGRTILSFSGPNNDARNPLEAMILHGEDTDSVLRSKHVKDFGYTTTIARKVK